MKRIALLLVTLMLACQGDVTTPNLCASGCNDGKVEIVSTNVVWRTSDHNLYSGDTLTVMVSLKNTGTGPSDTLRMSLDVGGTYYGNPSVQIPQLVAGQGTDLTISMAAALIHSGPAASIGYSVYVYGGSSASKSFRDSVAFKPSYLQVIGPDTIRTGVPATLEVSVVNPAPWPVHSAYLSICYLSFSCTTPEFRYLAPEIPPRSTGRFAVQTTFPVPEDRQLPLIGGAVFVCYGFVVIGGECGRSRAVLKLP